MKRSQLIIISLLVLLGLAARLLPHPANFTPITAIALFAGLYLPGRYAVIVPLIALFLSDLFIGLYSPAIMASVYVSFAAAALIGLFVRKHKKFSTILGGTMLGSVVFFLVTNAAVWYFGSMYAPTLAGLLESYTMALPFFRNSLIGDLFYTGMLVGVYEAIQYTWARKGWKAI